MEILEHLFRREAGRMAAVLVRLFGLNNLALAEDLVQDAFCRAMETWPYRGVPDNPQGWLMATAKNRALDTIRRERTATRFAPELTRFLESEWTLAPTIQEIFSAEEIQDSQLRMMFSCCHPRLPEESQVALILNILCGFGVSEIAAAFVSSHAAMEKRLVRAKKGLAQTKNLFDISASAAFAERLPAIQRAIYLLFNEGYHGASDQCLRLELCQDALRLVSLVLDHPRGATPGNHALAASLCLHAARLPGRVDTSGALVPLLEQDRSRWDQKLILDGLRLLELAATGPELTAWHLEAAIAAAHASAATAEATDWREIVSLYDMLMKTRPTPIIALNRAIAIGQCYGAERGMKAIRSIPDSSRLASYPFYSAALGEFSLRSGELALARRHFEEALGMARSGMEAAHFRQRILRCATGSP
jgi:RNA polymerase sigma factor (sigma-70 family)